MDCDVHWQTRNYWHQSAVASQSQTQLIWGQTASTRYDVQWHIVTSKCEGLSKWYTTADTALSQTSETQNGSLLDIIIWSACSTLITALITAVFKKVCYKRQLMNLPQLHCIVKRAVEQTQWQKHPSCKCSHLTIVSQRLSGHAHPPATPASTPNFLTVRRNFMAFWGVHPHKNSWEKLQFVTLHLSCLKTRSEWGCTHHIFSWHSSMRYLLLRCGFCCCFETVLRLSRLD